jgi:NADH-quinone oxidoreductase subunit H
VTLTPEFWTYAKVVLLVATVPAIVGFVVVLAERRLMGFMQARLGPNRVGPQGVLQGVADLVKLVTKEDITPARAEKAVYFLSPVLAVIPSLTALAVIPFGPPVKVGKVMVPLWVADINIGLLFLLAITSIGVYGIILGGWSSNNKYSLLGGLRSAAQLVSYEVPMGLSLVAVLLMTRSLSLPEIVRRQEATHLWFVFPGLVSFFIYFVSGIAETNRNPFDLPEAESELVSGFNTEYSGVKFAFFFLGEYTAMIIISCVAVTSGSWRRSRSSSSATSGSVRRSRAIASTS